MNRLIALMMLTALVSIPAFGHAKVMSKAVEYRHGEVVLEGYVAYPAYKKGRHPGVLVVHEWMGLNDYAKKRADQLAQLGYVALAVDMYGKGIRAADAKEAAALAGKYKGDRPLMRGRIQAALDLLKGLPKVDPKRIAAIGYCFGGTTVLELARSGADIAGVVSFHGGLDTPMPAEPGQVKAKVLVLHGGDDPLVPPEQVNGFEAEMRKAGVDWQLVAYGGTVHSFTNPQANDPARGVAYDAKSDRRSWQAMRSFFDEIF